MEDLSEKLNDILNDEESMKKVKALAEGLLSKESNEESNTNNIFGDIDPNELNTIISVLGRLKNGKDDKRTALLTALKPNLSEEKQKKVDTAIKLLKLIEILPYLKESGILNLF